MAKAEQVKATAEKMDGSLSTFADVVSSPTAGRCLASKNHA